MAAVMMAPCDETMKMKMLQVCSPSPGKFAMELLDILDASVDEPAVLPIFRQEATPPVLAAKGRKRKSIAAEVGNEKIPAKKPNTAKKESQNLNEQDLTTQRRKELNTMTLPRIKDMVSRKGLGLGKKDKMVESIIAAESQSRENICKHKSNANVVLIQKREELAGKSNKDLKELLKAYALQTSGKKPEFVERLLATWQEQGEIEKAMVGIAFRARKAELASMDKDALFELCRKKGVDALSKDVLLDRLLVHESAEIWQELAEARPQMKGVNPLSILWSR